MPAVLSLLVLVLSSLFIIRVGTVALVLTGLSEEVARFQAMSAFLGVGYTTNESEAVVGHPVRRRLLMWMMVTGNVGIATGVTTLVLTFMTASHTNDGLTRLLVLFLGLSILWVSGRSTTLDRVLTAAIQAALRHWTDLEVRDYAGLLRLAGGYLVMELAVDAEDWLAEQRLEALELHREGILVLGIERADGSYVGAPTGRTRVHAQDVLVLYGPATRLAELDSRRADQTGEMAHAQAIASETERQDAAPAE